MHRTNRHGNSTFTVLWGKKQGNRSYPRLSLPLGQFDITTVLQPALPPSTTRYQLVLVVRLNVYPYHDDRVSASLHAIKPQYHWGDIISFISYHVSSATTRTTAVLATTTSNAIYNRRYIPLTTTTTSLP